MENERYERVKSYLLEQIDNSNIVQLEKIDRYMNLLSIFYDLDQEIDEHGRLVVTENASQRFLKPNPAVNEKNKINSSLLSIEKSLGLDKVELEEEPSSDLL